MDPHTKAKKEYQHRSFEIFWTSLLECDMKEDAVATFMSIDQLKVIARQAYNRGFFDSEISRLKKSHRS